MDDPRRILIIDDDPGLRALLDATLGKAYAIEQACDGEAGIETAQRLRPDLILLDIAMPGMTGYETCMLLKRDDDTRDIPVIFLSALIELEDRLAAYEAGGEDFIGKPFDPEELLDKVVITLRYADERKQLADQAHSAFSTAMAAMSTAGEIGVVMDFMRRSFASTSHEQLADIAIESCAALGLNASIQVRTETAIVSRNQSGVSSPMEAAVLKTLSECGRIVALGARLAVNYPQVTLMLTDMPIADPDRVGRLRDDLAMLAEAADSRAIALDHRLALLRQQETLARLLERTRFALADIEQHYQTQMAGTEAVIFSLMDEIDKVLWDQGLSESQEAAISATLRQAVERVRHLFSEGLNIDLHLRDIMAELSMRGNGK